MFMMMMMMMQRRRLVLPPSLSNSNNGITVLMKSILTALLRNVISFLLVWTMISTPTTQAMMASPHVFFVEQFEDTIGLKIKGDEHEHWVTDIDDYTVVKNEKGEYRYAELSVDRKKLVPSNKKVGKSSNQKYSESKVWKKNIRPDKDEYNDHNTNIFLDGGPAVVTPSTSSKRRARSPRGGNSSCDDNGGAGDIPYASSLRNKQVPYEREEHHRRIASTAPVIGTLKNLVILLKFKDHKNQNRSVPSKDDVSVLMNSEEVDEDLAPTGSLKMIYWENSYGQLTIESEVTDWIDVKEDESYYANGQSGIDTAENKFHEALKDALDQLESENFNFTKFDKDGDDNIDGITFLTSGYGAEWGNVDEYGASYDDRIWSHKWRIQWRSSKTGVRVSDYHVSPSLWGTSGSKIGRVGVIAHEIGHFLGLPDLYDTDNSGNGLGFFCMMANSWGYDGSQRYPPHLSAWSKALLGWITPQTPSIGEEHRVARSEGYATSEAPHHVFKIGDGKFGFPPNEYLMIEYRRTDWLKGGIAIYHVDEKTQNYNNEGYPGQIQDEMRWPSNGNHYKVALMAADGNYELEKRINQGNSDDLYGMNQSLLPSKDANGPFPNTDSYQDGNIDRTGVQIYVTSDTDESYMTFLFSHGINMAEPSQLLVSENFDDGSSVFSFGSTAKVVSKNKCKGGRCVMIKRNKKNKSTSTMSVTIPTSSFVKIEVAFEFYADRFKKGEAIILEYSPVGARTEEWDPVQSWVKGGVNTFVNRKWISTTLDWSLPETDASSIVLRFRTTSKKKKLFIDNVIIQGKW